MEFSDCFGTETGPQERAPCFKRKRLKSMIDIKQFLSAIKQIAEEKGIPEASVLETVEAAIAAAYKRDYGKKGQIVRAKLDSETGDITVTQIHYVVQGVDDEGFITGPLPKKVLEEKPDVQDLESQRKREASLEGVEPGGELKIKFNPEKHVLLEEAHDQNPDIVVGDELVTPIQTHTEFGRIAAQTAKQVVIQRLREAERAAIFSEFKVQEGKVVSGVEIGRAHV